MSDNQISNATNKSAKTKKCFVVARIGADNSAERRETDGLLEEVLRPVLEGKGYEVRASHEVSTSGSISRHIMESLLNDDLVVCDLTGTNPNVMYELAVRHASGLPVVTLMQEGGNIPFDIGHERTVFYVNDMKGCAELKKTLGEFVDKAVSAKTPDNPIHRVRQDFALKQVEGASDPQEAIMRRLDGLEGRIQSLAEIRQPVRLVSPFSGSNLERSVNQLYVTGSSGTGSAPLFNAGLVSPLEHAKLDAKGD